MYESAPQLETALDFAVSSIKIKVTEVATRLRVLCRHDAPRRSRCAGPVADHIALLPPVKVLEKKLEEPFQYLTEFTYR